MIGFELKTLYATKIDIFVEIPAYKLTNPLFILAKKWSLISIVAGILAGLGYAGIFGLGYFGTLL